MSEGSWIGIVVLASGLAAVFTPLSILLARRFGLLDRPGGWKEHARATPYLGGLAIVAATICAFAVFAPRPGHLTAVIAVALLMLVIGVIDDRFTLRAPPRVGVELIAGYILWEAGLGWSLGGDALDLALTMVWTVAVINAINLLDLMDGVTTAIVATAAAGCAALAIANGENTVAALSVATAAASLGFLPFNLASPPKAFLGDGGTMPLGVILAAVSMGALAGHHESAASLAIGACLLGVPLFDLVVRVVLRRSRRIPLLTAGPDSLANQLLGVLGSPRLVTLVLAATQAVLSALAVAAADGRATRAFTLLIIALLAGTTAALLLHSPGRRGEVSMATSND